MPHANQLELGPGMVRFGREEKADVFERLAQAGCGHHLKIKIEPGGVGAAASVLRLGWMKLRDDPRTQGAELDRRAFLPMAAAARAPLGEPGEQAAIVVEKRAGDAVLVGQQDRQEIAEPAEEDLVVGVEEFRAVGRLVAKSPHLKKVARAFLELRRIDPQVDLDARLERVVARLDFPDDAQFAAGMGRDVVLAGGKPFEQLLAERIGLLRPLLPLEIGPVEVRLERGRNLAVVTAENLAGQAPGKLLAVRLAADGRADVGIEEIGQVDLRFLEQRAELGEAVPLAAGLKKAGESLAFRTGTRRGMGYGARRHGQSVSMPRSPR